MRLAVRPWAQASTTAAAARPLVTATTSRASSSSPGSDDPMGDLLALRSKLGKDSVKWLLPSYVDMHGVSKSKVVPLSHMLSMMGGSEMYTGAALDGVVRPPLPNTLSLSPLTPPPNPATLHTCTIQPQDMSDPEICSIPDAASCVVLPW